MEIFQSTTLPCCAGVDTHNMFRSAPLLVAGSVLGVVFPEENSSQD